MSFVEVRGDATKPTGTGPKIVMHCCNDLGRFGAGFASAVSRQWPKAKEAYLAWYSKRDMPEGVATTGPMGLGESQLVQVGDKLWVANLIGQHGVGVGSGGRAPIRYDALRKGLLTTYRWADIHKASIHAPRLGSGLAGGSWDNIKVMIQNAITDKGMSVTVYIL